MPLTDNLVDTYLAHRPAPGQMPDLESASNEALRHMYQQLYGKSAHWKVNPEKLKADIRKKWPQPKSAAAAGGSGIVEHPLRKEVEPFQNQEMLSYIEMCEKKIAEVKARNTVVATCSCAKSNL